MGDAPDEPRDEPAELEAAPVDHGLAAANRRKVTVVTIGERSPATTQDKICGVNTLLLCDRRYGGKRSAIGLRRTGRVADSEDPFVSRNSKVRFNEDPAVRVMLRPEPLRSGRCLDAGGPDDRPGENKLLVELHVSGADVANRRIQSHFDTEVTKRSLGGG